MRVLCAHDGPSALREAWQVPLLFPAGHWADAETRARSGLSNLHSQTAVRDLKD